MSNPGINPGQFRKLINLVTEKIGLQSPQATELLLGTAAQESHLGNYIYQLGGPACGVFQMEPATEVDIWNNYLKYKIELRERVISVTRIDSPSTLHLSGNLVYGIAMARIHYLRVKSPLPDPLPISELGMYWKLHYNTPNGRGTIDEFIENYGRFVLMVKD